jgi:Cys-rich protein (TIGR01571 family)
MLFWAPLPSTFPDDRLQAPFGHWKDGVFHCLSLGMCHTTLWCSLFCPHLQVAQVMTRMRLNCLGQFGPPQNTQNAFYLVLSAGVLYGIVSTILAVAQLPYPAGEEPILLSLANFVGSAAFITFLVVTLCQTRKNVRKQYGIPGRTCEDLFCSLCCTCCTVAQIARHTGNYEIHPAVCCTETGHPPTAPLSV